MPDRGQHRPARAPRTVRPARFPTTRSLAERRAHTADCLAGSSRRCDHRVRRHVGDESRTVCRDREQPWRGHPGDRAPRTGPRGSPPGRRGRPAQEPLSLDGQPRAAHSAEPRRRPQRHRAPRDPRGRRAHGRRGQGPRAHVRQRPASGPAHRGRARPREQPGRPAASRQATGGPVRRPLRRCPCGGADGPRKRAGMARPDPSLQRLGDGRSHAASSGGPQSRWQCHQVHGCG